MVLPEFLLLPLVFLGFRVACAGVCGLLVALPEFFFSCWSSWDLPLLVFVDVWWSFLGFYFLLFPSPFGLPGFHLPHLLFVDFWWSFLGTFLSLLGSPGFLPSTLLVFVDFWGFSFGYSFSPWPSWGFFLGVCWVLPIPDSQLRSFSRLDLFGFPLWRFWFLGSASVLGRLFRHCNPTGYIAGELLTSLC